MKKIKDLLQLLWLWYAIGNPSKIKNLWGLIEWVYNADWLIHRLKYEPSSLMFDAYRIPYVFRGHDFLQINIVFGKNLIRDGILHISQRRETRKVFCFVNINKVPDTKFWRYAGFKCNLSKTLETTDVDFALTCIEKSKLYEEMGYYHPKVTDKLLPTRFIPTSDGTVNFIKRCSCDSGRLIKHNPGGSYKGYVCAECFTPVED